MPRGANDKREGEYKKLEERFEQEGRYPGREEEVAARIVNKQRAEYGETRDEQKQEHSGSAPDRHLPIQKYDSLTVDEVSRQLDGLSAAQLRQVRDYEKQHKNRRGVLDALDRSMK